MSRLVLVQHYISLHYIKLIYQLAQHAYIIYCMTVIYLSLIHIYIVTLALAQDAMNKN